MIKTFKSKALAELWNEGKTKKLDGRMRGRILRCLDRLDAAVAPREMNVAGFEFHALRGFRPPRYTVHVNGPWRVTFEFKDGHAWQVDFEQYH